MLLNLLWNAFKFQEHPWCLKSQHFSTFDYGKSNYCLTVWSCDKGDLPWVPEIFFACDEELRRPQADQSSAFGRRHGRRSFSRGSLFKTWPRVKATRPFTIIPVMSGGRLFFSQGVNVLVKEKKSQFSSLFFL